MKNGFKIIDFQEIDKAMLDPHPAAEAFLRTDEDQTCVNRSVASHGVLTPLHVMDKGDGRYWVIDGITRYNAAAKDDLLPCLIVECDDVDAFVLNQNCARRRVSTGTRILAYLIQHKELVLAADERYGGGRFAGSEKGANGGKRSSVHHVNHRYTEGELFPWSCLEIAKELGVSRNDVQAAVDLLRCSELGRLPQVKSGKNVHPERDADHDSEEDAAMLEQVRYCRMRVLGGDLPIRKWTSAFYGRVVTEHGRGEIDYARVGINGMTGVISMFNHWDEVPEDLRGDLIRKFLLVQEAYRNAIAAL